MTGLRNSQLATISVEGGTGKLAASQLASISVLSNPAATGLRASQLFAIIVISNGKNLLPLGPAFKLACWQPCTAYGTRATVVRFR
jgi:hypothetical protein